MSNLCNWSFQHNYLLMWIQIQSTFKNVNMLQAFWDSPGESSKPCICASNYFNYKHIFIESKKIISFVVSVNTDLTYTNIPDAQLAVKMKQWPSAFSTIYAYVSLWQRDHLWDVRVTHLTLPKEGHIHLFYIHSYSQDESSKQKVDSSMLSCLLFSCVLLKTNVCNWLVIVANRF